ncbi:hypothetical protein I6E29_03385 [Arcanobacterium haemolyticum]|nr:hypothetical protein [Arcanobacterium haemolyticum]
MSLRSKRINVRGRVDAITYPGAGCPPVVSVMLSVADTVLVLAFLGRTDLHAIDVGSVVHVKGILTSDHGMPTVFNPMYQVESTEGEM